MWSANLKSDSRVHRDIAIYIHQPTDKAILQIKSGLRYNEACLLDISLP